MKFDDLDAQMRIFETHSDYTVLPGMYMVARLDGRGFTKLTKERHSFEAPFDERFRDMMAATVEHLMDCGFRILYGYTQSDEISLLFHPEEDTFNWKTRKYNSVLAGEASAKFSLLLDDLACLDCRICELPRPNDVQDYFRWRQEDAHRNALNAHCYWMLRKQGLSEQKATAQLRGQSVADKNELLFQAGINFNDLPGWQKRGSGFYWEDYQKIGIDPRTGESNSATRRRIHRNMSLPLSEDYSNMIRQFISADV